LLTEHRIAVSLRTVERAVAPLRGELAAEARATVRFETPPGKQMQIDFGEKRVVIGGEMVRAYLFVATLGHSRRLHVRAFRHERQACWFEGLESAFRAFGGVPEEVLLDNTRALVLHHDSLTREVRFNARLLAFAKHWGFRPWACAPYRARTKGKDERGVGYVKSNAIGAAGGGRELRVPQADPPERLEQDIGEGREPQAQLVGAHGRRGGAIGEQVELLLLDNEMDASR
jgi:transposase